MMVKVYRVGNSEWGITYKDILKAYIRDNCYYIELANKIVFWPLTAIERVEEYP